MAHRRSRNRSLASDWYCSSPPKQSRFPWYYPIDTPRDSKLRPNSFFTTRKVQQEHSGPWNTIDSYGNIHTKIATLPTKQWDHPCSCQIKSKSCNAVNEPSSDGIKSPTQILPLCSLLHFYRKSVNFTIHSSFMQPCEPGPCDVVPQRASGSIPCCGTMTHMKHRFKMSMQAFQITTRIRLVSCGRNHDVLCSSLRTNLAQRQKEIKTDFQRGSPRSKGKLNGEQKQPFT